MFSLGDLVFNGLGVAFGFWIYGFTGFRIRMEALFKAVSRGPTAGGRPG